MEFPIETQKVLSVCKLLNSTPGKITPKRFLQIFLESEDSEIAYLRRLWAQPRGIDSTMHLVTVMRNEITKTQCGRELWSAFIQQQV